MIGRECCHENLFLYTVQWTLEQGRKKCIGVDLKRIVSYWQCWLLLPAPGVWTDSVDPNFSPCVFLQREQERETWQIVFRQKKVQILYTLHCRKKIFWSSSGKLHLVFFPLEYFKAKRWHALSCVRVFVLILRIHLIWEVVKYLKQKYTTFAFDIWGGRFSLAIKFLFNIYFLNYLWSFPDWQNVFCT